MSVLSHNLSVPWDQELGHASLSGSSNILNLTSPFEIFDDDTVTEQDVLLEKTYPFLFYKLVRIHQTNSYESKHLSDAPASIR